MDKLRKYPAQLEPLLAPSKLIGMDIPHSSIRYPKLVSIKYNGIRALTMDGTWKSRNMRPLAMSQEIAYALKPILDYAEENCLVLDGEVHSQTYNTVGETRSILAGNIPLPDDFVFKCFYALPYSVWNGAAKIPMLDNLANTISHLTRFKPVKQTLLQSSGEFLSLIEKSKNLAYEGFMLLDPTAMYVHGKKSVSQQILLKYKYYDGKEDAKIVGLIPKKARKSNARQEQAPTGRAQAVYTQESFVETDIAGTMRCHLEGDPKNVIHVPFPLKWDNSMRHRAFVHFNTGSEFDLQGEWVQFRRLACENRDKPIAIKGVEFRDAKD